jgi:hypothetical protein
MKRRSAATNSTAMIKTTAMRPHAGSAPRPSVSPMARRSSWRSRSFSVFVPTFARCCECEGFRGLPPLLPTARHYASGAAGRTIPPCRGEQRPVLLRRRRNTSSPPLSPQDRRPQPKYVRCTRSTSAAPDRIDRRPRWSAVVPPHVRRTATRPQVSGSSTAVKRVATFTTEAAGGVGRRPRARTARSGCQPRTAETRHSSGTPFSRRDPRSSNSIMEPATRSLTVEETRISWGAASAEMR